jgi:signal transduction histidine kinase
MFKLEKNSIRSKLFFSISIIIALSLLLIYLLGFFNTKKEIQSVLDANMAKNSKLVLSLIYHELEEGEQDGFLDDFEDKINKRVLHEYENKIHIQVWKNDLLIYASNHHDLIKKPTKEGFVDVKINNENWRCFTLFEKEKITVVILEQYQIRQNLTWRIFASPFIPLLISCVMIFIIWIFIDQKIGALNILSSKIAHLSAYKLSPIKLEVPTEIKPLFDSLNDLIVRLNDSIQAERRFTDYAAHELRTPLTAVKTHIQLLIKDKSKINDSEYLDDLEKSIQRMINLVSQILLLARIEVQNAEIESEKFSLNKILHQEISQKETQINENNLTINFDESSYINYFGNKLFIEILLKNLIDNAIKYSHKSGKIEIIVKNKELIIRNLGNFINKENSEKLFDIFFRINDNNTSGSGLGLAIVKKIALLHKIKINFSSKKIDEKRALNQFELIF